MLLTPEQIREIRELIERHHTAFVVNTFGPQVVPEDVRRELERLGLLKPGASVVEDAYLYGQLLAQMDTKATATMGYEQFKQQLERHPIPLTDIERAAIESASTRAGQYAHGLGNVALKDWGGYIVNGNQQLREQMREIIRDKTAETIARRRSARELKSDLGWATGDWTRDLNRIAVTELQTAMLEGQTDSLFKEFGQDVEVFRRPMPDACQHCKRLYLGPDGHPRIFKLSWLTGNGANYKLKASEWKPVAVSTHPNCQCPLERVPQGWGFDEDGDLVPGGRGGHRYADEQELRRALADEQTLRKAWRTYGTIDYQGIPVVVENPAGSVRQWTAPDGRQGETRMVLPYGYVRRTGGADGDEIDVFVGPDPRSQAVYVVHQIDPLTGAYDEDKVFLGCNSRQQAEAYYLMHFDSPEFLGSVTELELQEFQRQAALTAPPDLSWSKAQTGTTGVMHEPAPNDVAGARSPGPGLGINYVLHEPQPERAQPVVVDFKDLVKDPQELERQKKLHRENERATDMVYMPRQALAFQEPVPRRLWARDDAADLYEEAEVLPEHRTAYGVEPFHTEARRNKGAVRNTVDPADQQQPEQVDIQGRRIIRKSLREVRRDGPHWSLVLGASPPSSLGGARLCRLRITGVTGKPRAAVGVHVGGRTFLPMA